MSWYGWLALAVSLVGWFLTWRVAAWLVTVNVPGVQDGEAVAFGVVIGALVALAWPVVVPGYLLHKHGRLIGAGRTLIRPPKQERERIRVAELEKRIAELEREARLP